MVSSIILPVIIIITIAGGVGIYFAYYAGEWDQKIPEPVELPTVDVNDTDGTQKIKKFASEEEVRRFLSDAQSSKNSRFGFGLEEARFQSNEMMDVDMLAESAAISESTSTGRVDFSSTNIQVAQVDEPDFIKTDGKYIYMIKEHMLVIVEAYPASEAKIISKVAFDVEPQNLQNMFLNKDRLMIFYSANDIKEIISEFGFRPMDIRVPVTHMVIIDISDRSKPVIIKDYQVDGSFMDARMIGDYVYFISTKWIDYRAPMIPRIVDSESNEVVLRPDVFYFDNPGDRYNFNIITAINISELERISAETFLVDPASTIYVSQDSLYMAYQKNLPSSYYEEITRDTFFSVIVPLLPEPTQDAIIQINDGDSIEQDQKWPMIMDLLQDTYDGMNGDDLDLLFKQIDKASLEYLFRIMSDAHQTVIHKILLDEGSLEFQASGEVPGRLLNQFSMDQHDDRLRVATTNERMISNEWTVDNSVHIMNSDDLSMVGSLGNLAPSESIFSARFMGDRLYLVTFERIDPFFVIDLSTDQPRVLGELKIPGFSNYLHPYDEDHVIGIGRDTKESSDRVIQLGVKLALFDVSDVRNPSVLDDIVIGSSSTHSEAEYNHKSFFFDKRKNILSIPIEDGQQQVFDVELMQDGDSWNGFYVYGLDTQDGFDLKGKIEHLTTTYWYSPSRSLYIEDTLYTVSSNLIKMNEIDNIENEINVIDLRPKGQIIEFVK